MRQIALLVNRHEGVVGARCVEEDSRVYEKGVSLYVGELLLTRQRPLAGCSFVQHSLLVAGEI